MRYELKLGAYSYILEFLNDAGYRERVYAGLVAVRNQDQFDIDSVISVTYDPSRDTVTLFQEETRLTFAVRREATAALDEIHWANASFHEVPRREARRFSTWTWNSRGPATWTWNS
jgi:hypothetical protein